MADGQPGARGAGGERLWELHVDRGGTFTDCIGVAPDGSLHTAKLLSSETAPVEAIREALEAAGAIAPGEPLPRCRVRLGTTVATNALLERRGVRTLLVADRGLADVFAIGTQERPELFDLHIRKPPPVHERAVEVPGRVGADGAEVEPLDEAAAREALAEARGAAGIDSVAVVLAHAYAHPEHERRLAELAREAGFRYVVASHEVAREMGLLARGDTAAVDAYLTPLLRSHVSELERALPGSRLRFMQSSGGVTDGGRFRGPTALLSGPAGGVVGAARVARTAGFPRAIGFDMGGTSTDVSLVSEGGLERAFETVVGGVRVKAPMLRIHTIAAGGGSLCRFDGFRLTVGPESAGADPGPRCYGRHLPRGAPPEQGLALTDVNLFLGRIQRDRFAFPLARSPVDEALRALQERLEAEGQKLALDEIASGFVEVANASMAQAIQQVSVARGVDPRDHALVGFGGAGGQHVCAVARQLGIRTVLLHPLAGLLSAYGIGVAESTWDGQRDAGRVTLPGSGGPLPAALRAAFAELEGAGRAALEAEGARPEDVRAERSLDLRYRGTETALAVREPSIGDGAAGDWTAAFEAVHHARFGYTRPGRPIEITTARVRARSSARGALADLPAQPGAADTAPGSPAPPEAEDAAERRSAALREAQAVRVPAARPEGKVAAERPPAPRVEAEDAGARPPPEPRRTVQAYFPGGGRVPAPVYDREALEPGVVLRGPAIVLEDTGTVVLDPGFTARVRAGGLLVLSDETPAWAAGPGRPDPVRLEVFGNRFMSIAEQMGAVLRNTSVSTNIKERLDYSCAVFDPQGGLVANAPHIPVHLGAMGETVRAVLEETPDLEPGDAIVTNDPFRGGSHLPDVTVVTPVFVEDDVASRPRAGASAARDAHGDDRSAPADADPAADCSLPGARSGDGSPARRGRSRARPAPAFFVASRGHHADVGGRTPGSMPSDSRTLEEEGVVLPAFKLVHRGHFDEARVRAALTEAPYPARNPDDNVADLEAMVAANRAGARLLLEMVAEHSRASVEQTMRELQSAAAQKVGREIGRIPDGEHRFEDRMDDGTPVCVRLTVLGERMAIDFTGTGAAVGSNLNAPPAVVRAAVIYVLRTLVAERIPLNGGCLAPVEIAVPPGSLLDPPPGSAVVGGNVETSQRIVDVLLGAIGRVAASQGTMNNVAFGDEHFGYYETIGGGAGAGDGFDGASGVHTHMTNTRITDPEVMESRYPVRLVRFALRRGSGGAGRWRGGDGLVRRYTFLRPVSVSILSERRATAPYGLHGGAPGTPGRNLILRRDGRTEELPGRATAHLDPGDHLQIETPGAGAFGPPPE